MIANLHAQQTGRRAEGKFHTVGEIAHQLNVSPRTVHRWIANRQLAVHRFGRRSVRVSDADLKAFVAINRDAE
jgi:excisionase family DNA binding protein